MSPSRLGVMDRTNLSGPPKTCKDHSPWQCDCMSKSHKPSKSRPSRRKAIAADIASAAEPKAAVKQVAQWDATRTAAWLKTLSIAQSKSLRKHVSAAQLVVFAKLCEEVSRMPLEDCVRVCGLPDNASLLTIQKAGVFRKSVFKGMSPTTKNGKKQTTQ